MNVTLKEKYGLYINGEWRDASDGGTFATSNPATGEHLAYCAEATKEDVDDAVNAAWAAFPKVSRIISARPRCPVLMFSSDASPITT